MICDPQSHRWLRHNGDSSLPPAPLPPAAPRDHCCSLTLRESTAAYMMSIQPLKVAWQTEGVMSLCLEAGG